MNVTADLDLCQAHQMCHLEAPDVLGFDESADKVVVLVAEPQESERENVRRAVRYCPTMALTLTEEN